MTPISLAARNGHTKIVKMLVPMANNSNSPEKMKIHTPIYWAAYFGHTEIVRILAPLADNPNAPNSNGWTPIYHAKRFQHILKLSTP